MPKNPSVTMAETTGEPQATAVRSSASAAMLARAWRVSTTAACVEARSSRRLRSAASFCACVAATATPGEARPQLEIVIAWLEGEFLFGDCRIARPGHGRHGLGDVGSRRFRPYRRR